MYKCCCALCVRYDYASQQHRGFLTRILNNALAVTACQIKDTTSTDFDTYNEYICINGPELGSYWFSLILMWAENADENMQRKKPFAKFRMLQIEEDKHVYFIYIFVTLPFRTEVILLQRWNNYSPKAKRILVNIPRDEVEGNIHQYSRA